MKIPPPKDLRCEYLRDPLGIDEVNPRLSWVLTHPGNDEVQKAYRIIASSSPREAERANGDLWDSGKVISAENSLIPYTGPPLQARQRCFWRVQWWDSQDRASDFSETARFEIGLLTEKDWNAVWISRDNLKEFTSRGSTLLGEPLGDYINSFAFYLRKEYVLNGEPVQARAYVCGLGFYELRINGHKIGDRVLEPAQTDYRQHALYSTYDITKEILENRVPAGIRFAVGVILGNGRHIRSYQYEHPKLLCQFVIEYDDGRVEIIGTGDDWKTSYGALQENGIYYGERYDARLEERDWDRPGFDDSRWVKAIEVAGPRVISQMMEPIRVARVLKPLSRRQLPDGNMLVDFGQNLAGWVRIMVSGQAGTAVRLRHAELLNEDGTLNLSPNQNAEATDVYILRGEGSEQYEPRFTYHGFRYLEISALPELPIIESLEACFVHSDVEETGEFSCSHPLINRIHQNVHWGQLSNLMSIPTDCTQRDERQGWLGDAHLAGEESVFNFGMGAFYTKFLRDIQGAQRGDGSLPDTVPPYLGKLYPADPAWSAAYVALAWLMYQFYGDRRILERHFDSMKLYIEFLKSKSDGLILKTLGKYGDWCPPGSVAPKRTPVELTSTWFFYHDTLLLSRIAGVLGRGNDEKDLAELAQAILAAFNREFLKNGEYAVNRFAPVDRSPGQTSNTLPLYLEMVPSAERERVLNRLLQGVIEEQDYHLDTGILGTRYLLDVLSENGRTDVAFKVATQRTYPGWGYMVEEGATTLWERWEKIGGGGMNSHNHIMLGSVDAWFYRTLAGLSSVGPGWQQIQIKPPVLEGLNEANASVKSIRGFVCVSWEKTETSFRIKFTVPVGSTAKVYIPRLWDRQVVREAGTNAELTSLAEEPRRSNQPVSYQLYQCGSGSREILINKAS